MERIFTIQEILNSWNKSCKVNDNVDEEAKNVITEALELKLLEEQGLLPKFHLGEEFWVLHYDGAVKEKIIMLQQKKDGTWKYRFKNTCDFEENEFGKEFFDNKEDAEKRWKERWKN